MRKGPRRGGSSVLERTGHVCHESTPPTHRARWGTDREPQGTRQRQYAAACLAARLVEWQHDRRRRSAERNRRGRAAADPVRGQAGHRRAGPDGRAAARRAAGPRPLPAGGRARRRQDAGRATLATVVGGTFARIQFTPDLVPADIVGTRIYRPSTETFDVELGPVFANFVLADEINRAPAKVQSALLEVMAERQVSIGGRPTRCPSRSWCWPPRTRSSPRASTRCPRRSATGS